MGKSRRRGHPDHSSEYESREADDSAAETAQTTINEFTTTAQTSSPTPPDDAPSDTPTSGAESEVPDFDDFEASDTDDTTDPLSPPEASTTDLPDFEDFSAETSTNTTDDETTAAPTEPDTSPPDSSVSSGPTTEDSSKQDAPENTPATTEQSASGHERADPVETGETGDPMALNPTDEQQISVDLGPTDPATVQDEFDIDFSETDTVEDLHKVTTDETYERLSRDQRSTVQSTLAERYDRDAVSDLFEWIGDWKGKSKDDHAYGLELTAKRALGLDAPVRNADDFASPDADLYAEDPLPPEVTKDHIEAYRDLTRLSQALVRETHADEDGALSVRRGLRDFEGAELAAQAIDHPDADTYHFSTSTVSNHTTDRETAKEWSDPFYVDYEASADEVALSIDQVWAGVRESEVHVMGGEIEVADSDITHTGPSHKERDPQSFTEFTRAFDDPETVSEDTHEDAVRVLRTMKNEGITIETEEGATRLEHWVRTCDEKNLMASYRVSAAKSVVEDVTVHDVDV